MKPSADGLDVVDSTGVLTGNAGLFGEQGWTNTPDTADGHAAPLPGYPTGTWPTCLPVTKPKPSPIARIRDEFGDALIGFVCGMAVASYAAFLILQHVVLS